MDALQRRVAIKHAACQAQGPRARTSTDGATSGGSYWASATSAIPSTVSTRRETDNQSFSGFMAAGNLRRFAAGVKDFVPATVTFI